MSEPVRMCVACRRRRPKHLLLGVRRRRDGRIVPALGRGSPKAGRTAYLCPARACFDRAVRQAALGARAFRGQRGTFDPEQLWKALVGAVRDRSRTLRRTGARPGKVQAATALLEALACEEGDV